MYMCGDNITKQSTLQGQTTAQLVTPCTTNQAMPSIIEPCATVVNKHGYKNPAKFHLLASGHVVGIDDNDQRCGRNCQHSVTTIARLIKKKQFTNLCHRVLARLFLTQLDRLHSTSQSSRSPPLKRPMNSIARYVTAYRLIATERCISNEMVRRRCAVLWLLHNSCFTPCPICLVSTSTRYFAFPTSAPA